jgi:alkanesulfonate monooxygenase SsuD/methylene tetrahydromethanopterin reductase-like flavin-dependent oxidoreductase (luciferase family)
MRVGVVMWPIEDWPAMGLRWQQAERLGFDTAWTYDHTTWRGHTPWDDAYATLAAAASLTSRIRLGTLVTSPNFRHPVPTAAAIKTIDRISSGRLTIGIGAGSSAHTSDGDILDEDWNRRERDDRFEEFVTQLHALLSSAPVTLRGEFWAARDVTLSPGLVQRRPPFYVAGAGHRAMQLAATYGQGWIGNARNPDGLGLPLLKNQLERLDRACADAGRDVATIRRLVLTGHSADPWLGSVAAFEDLHGQYAEAGFTDVALHWPRPGTRWAAEADVFEDIAELVARRRGETDPELH